MPIEVSSLSQDASIRGDLSRDIGLSLILLFFHVSPTDPPPCCISERTSEILRIPPGSLFNASSLFKLLSGFLMTPPVTLQGF